MFFCDRSERSERLINQTRLFYPWCSAANQAGSAELNGYHDDEGKPRARFGLRLSTVKACRSGANLQNICSIEGEPQLQGNFRRFEALQIYASIGAYSIAVLILG